VAFAVDEHRPIVEDAAVAAYLKELPMSTLFPDTRPEAEQVQIELLRQAPAWRKLEMVGQTDQTLRTLALSGLRQRHPGATPEKLRRRLADLLLGPTLAAQAYGPLAPPDRS
jgi:hypothetical protein